MTVGATIRAIVDDALTVIGEVSGAGVQTYSEDRMMADAIRSFNLLFKKYTWDQFTGWFRFQPDGILGLPQTDVFTNVRDFEDILGVYKDGSPTPLPILAKSTNPYAISGTDLQYWSSLPATDANYQNRRIRLWPNNYAATNFINVFARIYPKANGINWAWDDMESG